MLNPETKIVKSKGVDLPVMYCYLAGRIAGNCMDKCMGWRKEIREHYKNYDSTGAYPIAFLDPLNSGETKTADKLGLTSHIPANLIYAKDILSVEKADVIVANMEDYLEHDIIDILGLFNENLYKTSKVLEELSKEKLIGISLTLMNVILNRRENFGTICEFAIALYLQKPIILIVPEKRKFIYEQHPFAKRASVIVTSVDELISGKYLELLYKSMASAIY